MRKNGMLLGSLAAAATLLAAAGAADAQEREMYELPALEVTAFQSPLNRQAMELYETPSRWEEAGELHERAAKVLPKNDAAAYFGFQRAAVLYFYAGNTARSRKTMERAAEVAEATGDVFTAANTWVDAAFLAIAEGYAGKKREFVRNAEALAGSTLLSDADRDVILARIDGSPASPQAARVAMARRLIEAADLSRAD
jgi:tetratricopeptide (TPR) repeat protein